MANLTRVEGIGPVYAHKLEDAGIATTQALLEKGASPKGRQEIAKQTGISDTLLLRWINHVDLFRVKGIGEEYADLLEVAGVDTVPELAQRNPEHLHQQLVQVNHARRRVRRLPTQTQVTDWIGQARQLPRVINY